MDPNELADLIDNARFEAESCRMAVMFGEEELSLVADEWERIMNVHLDRLHEELYPKEPEPGTWPQMTYLTPWTLPTFLKGSLLGVQLSTVPSLSLTNSTPVRKSSSKRHVVPQTG